MQKVRRSAFARVIQERASARQPSREGDSLRFGGARPAQTRLSSRSSREARAKAGWVLGTEFGTG
jgi:hypothetical protein